MLFTNPTSPEGRKMRIEYLMKSTGYDRDVCAGIIYARDRAEKDKPNFSHDEELDALRIRALLQGGVLNMPADKSE